MEDWLIESAKGIGKMFLNPLLYWFVIVLILASMKRIKKERQNFGTKIFDMFAENKRTWPVSLVSGVLLSLFAIGLGIVFNYAVILLLISIMFLFSIATKFTWLSAAYTFGFTFLLLLLIPVLPNDVVPADLVTEFGQVDLVSFTILLGIFIIIEAVMMMRVKRNETFPELIKGNRGKWVGQHRIKKIAIIPFFTLVPSGLILPFIEWWPIFSIGGKSYGLLVLPLMVGFEHVVKGISPIKGVRELGQYILILGLLTVGFAISGLYLAIMSIVAVSIAIIGREFISYRFKYKDQQLRPFFRPDQTGLVILGVIPGTPAERLGLLVGEKIIKVNGERVFSEQEFYEALQLSSSFCKLDIRDDRGEIRFVQRAMYQGEHYELGIVFAKNKFRRRKKERLA
ncbi:PDZ domain-containing protein [Aquibacillus halophilus]|uniref:PDZ domain-containing protein n=1 Tax=Aquibacillus halophilus TaxID=930132 RepID=A0A6A8DL65_9BACI|nr:PDZ domain-containing protein [Aquibacillus halophilus]MRH41992.1 PDZ domain-containing protein [Aquibacillus halophilus]